MGGSHLRNPRVLVLLLLGLPLLVSALAGQPSSSSSSSSSQQQLQLNLLDVLLEPPAQFHTRCITFMNGVLLKAEENPAKVVRVLKGQCGERKAGLETAELPKKEVQECQQMAEKFADQLKHEQAEKEKLSGSEDDEPLMIGEGVPAWKPPPKHPLEGKAGELEEEEVEEENAKREKEEREATTVGKRLVSSSHNVDRFHDHYALASTWCDELYTMAEKRHRAAQKKKRLLRKAAEKAKTKSN